MAFPTGWNKKHKLTVDNTKVSGSSNLTDFPVLLTGDNFLAEAFANSQGKEINESYLLADANLQGYWRHEADGSDSSGEGHTLTGTSPSFVAGLFGNCGDYEASSSQYLTINDANFRVTGSQSFGGWFTPESISGGVNRLMGRSNSGAAFNLVNLNFTAGAIQFQAQGLTTNTEVNSKVPAVAGNLYHVVGVYDSANSLLKIFVNGMKDQVTASGTATSAGTETFSIGRAGAYDADYYDGKADDCFFLDRALTDEEVVARYTGGDDLRFSSDVDGATQLAHEVINWDIGGSTAEVWVKIPTLSYDTDTVFYVWYDNTVATPLARSNTYGSDNVWNSGFKGVWHMQGGTFKDSTVNANNLTPVATPAVTTGKVGEGIDFEAADVDYAAINDNTSLSITGDLSFSFWADLETVTSGTFFSKYLFGTNNREYIFELSGSKWQIRYSSDGTSGAATSVTSTNVTTDTGFKHIFGTLDVSAKTLVLLENGSAVALDAVSGTSTAIFDGASPFRIGAQNDASVPFDGILDEINIYSGLLTSDWGITMYNNQSAPATFVTESAVSAFVPKVIVII